MAAIQLPQELFEGVKKKDPIAIAGKKIFAEQFQIFQDREAGTLSGQDIEDLHRMRVASRRMRVLLKTMRDIYGRDRISSLREGLRKAAFFLGELRDIDTFVIFLESYLPQLPDAVQSAVHELIDERLYARQKGLENLNREVSEPWYRHLKEGIFKLLTDHSEEDLQSAPVKVASPNILKSAFSSILAYGDKVFEADQEELHKLRILFKRNRYLSEFFASCYDESIRVLNAEFNAFQDVLGDMHDRHRDVLFIEESRRDLEQQLVTAKDVKSLDRLIARFEKDVEKERQKFFVRWRRLLLKENIIRFHYIIQNGIL